LKLKDNLKFISSKKGIGLFEQSFSSNQIPYGINQLNALTSISW